MRVIHVIDSLNVGGAEKVMINLSNLLYQNGMEVSVLILGCNDGELIDSLNPNIPIVRLKRTNKFSVISALKLIKILKKTDIVHVHMRHNFTYVSLYSRLFFLRAKILLHDHYGSIEFDKSVPKLFNTFLKPKYYVGVSTDLTNWAVNNLKMSNKNVFLLNNTIEKLSVEKKIVKKSNQCLNILMVGNIKPVKNQLFALKLINELDGKLTIYGKIQDEDYYQKLNREIELLGLQYKVNFIHNETHIQNCLSNYNFAIHTAKSESGPLVLIEYLAHNIPFLSYKTGDVSDILFSEIPNQFIDSFDTSQWTKKILEVFYNTQGTERLYEKYFSPLKYVENCKHIYKAIK